MNTTKLTQIFVIGACAVVIMNQAIIPIGKSVITRINAYGDKIEKEKARVEREKRLEERGPRCKMMLQRRIDEIKNQHKGLPSFLARESMEYSMSTIDNQYSRCVDYNEDF